MSLADDWMDLVDQDVDQIAVKKAGAFEDENILEEAPKQQPPAPVPAKDPHDSKVIIKQEPLQTIKAQPPSPYGVSTTTKPTTITNQERRKAELMARLADERNIEDLFEGLSTENKQYTQSQVVLKNQKDFSAFAKTVFERFEEDTESELIEDFAVELLVSLYQQLKSKDYDILAEKLKILKNEKKKDQKQNKKKKKETKKEEKPVEKSRRELDMDDFM